MSTFTINFNAQFPGQHIIGYRTYNTPANTYLTVTQDVTAIGDVSVEIQVPGNLYCAHAGITYDYYVLARCLNETLTDTNLDGVPDFAVTDSITIAQETDPCNVNVIECIAAPISTVTITDNGTSLCTDGTYNVVVTAAPGTELSPADITVTVSGGLITSYTINDGGLYTTNPTLSVTIPNCSTSPTLTCVLGTSPLTLDTLVYGEITIYDGYGVTHDMEIGDILTLSVNPAIAVTLGDAFDVTAYSIENCHCNECAKITVDSTDASTGFGKLIYQTCWDQGDEDHALRTIVRKMNPDVILSLGCILNSTLNILEGTLDGNVTFTTALCE